jgi:two-component system, chemotaxis family, sensor kinase CheA
VQEDDEVVHEFLIESRDNLDLLDRELVALEVEPKSSTRLDSVFRTIHTIKGTAGFLSFGKLETIAHAGESLLSKLRDGSIALDSTRTTGLLVMVDAIRTLLAQITSTGREGPEHYGGLVESLLLLMDDASLPAAGKLLNAVAPEATERAASLRVPARAPKLAVPVDIHPVNRTLAPKQEVPVPAAPKSANTEASAAADPRIRVDVALLDRLMNLVGELVLARNQLLQHTSLGEDAGLAATCQRLNFITCELQEGVMKTRMQPIVNVWNKFPRVVRDLSQACGKQIALEMEGKTTELDKTIIEAVSDPMTHLVRNAIDHGIETPTQRSAAGKPPTGTLRLRAFHEGGRVNIEIADDGRGIDVERVRAKAVERGLFTADRARSASHQELVNLIFAPGFSTAEQVTNVSGRGVGMDVVRSNIEGIGGSVEVDSKRGIGTAIRIKIPLTLAIIPALVVGAAGQRFAIPQVNLVELVRFDADQAKAAIEHIHGVPLFRLRGSLVALVELSTVLESPSTQRDEYNVVVLQADDRQFGLLVDSIFDTEEIVVKPLARELKGLNLYAGATIMGDGRVALILDVLGLADRAQVGATQHRLSGLRAAEKKVEVARQSQRLILFRSGPGARMALPLDSVARLEEFPRSRVESVGREDVIQYRGEILPLVHLSDVFGGKRGEQEFLQVVVHQDDSGSVGFVVDAIDDIVETEENTKRRGGRRGTVGSLVIHGRVTELLDAAAIRGEMLSRHV